MSNILAVVNGTHITLGQGGIIAVVATVFVFIILGIIIAITYGAGMAIERASADKAVEEKTVATPGAPAVSAAVMDDEDAAVAVLVASIDYRNETGKNIKVLGVKEIR